MRFKKILDIRYLTLLLLIATVITQSITLSNLEKLEDKILRIQQIMAPDGISMDITSTVDEWVAHHRIIDLSEYYQERKPAYIVKKEQGKFWVTPGRLIDKEVGYEFRTCDGILMSIGNGLVYERDIPCEEK